MQCFFTGEYSADPVAGRPGFSPLTIKQPSFHLGRSKKPSYQKGFLNVFLNIAGINSSPLKIDPKFWNLGEPQAGESWSCTLTVPLEGKRVSKTGDEQKTGSTNKKSEVAKRLARVVRLHANAWTHF